MSEIYSKLAEEAKTKIPAGLIVDNWIARYNEEFGKLIITECLNIIESSDGDLDFAIWQINKYFGLVNEARE